MCVLCFCILLCGCCCCLLVFSFVLPLLPTHLFTEVTWSDFCFGRNPKVIGKYEEDVLNEYPSDFTLIGASSSHASGPEVITVHTSLVVPTTETEKSSLRPIDSKEKVAFNRMSVAFKESGVLVNPFSPPSIVAVELEPYHAKLSSKTSCNTFSGAKLSVQIRNVFGKMKFFLDNGHTLSKGKFLLIYI